MGMLLRRHRGEPEEITPPPASDQEPPKETKKRGRPKKGE